MCDTTMFKQNKATVYLGGGGIWRYLESGVIWEPCGIFSLFAHLTLDTLNLGHFEFGHLELWTF